MYKIYAPLNAHAPFRLPQAPLNSRFNRTSGAPISLVRA